MWPRPLLTRLVSLNQLTYMTNGDTKNDRRMRNMPMMMTRIMIRTRSLMDDDETSGDEEKESNTVPIMIGMMPVLMVPTLT